MSMSADNKEGTLNLNVRLHKFGNRFLGTFPKMSKPQPIGFYSINAARELLDNASCVSYLRLPPNSALPLDLNAGIDTVQRKEIEPEYHEIHKFCHYISNHPELLRVGSDGRKTLATDFVTFRGILRQIMCTPYQNDEYRLMAMRLNGSIYISKLETDEQRDEREKMTVHNLNMCSWGFKFEQYCTTPDPSVEPDTSGPVQEGVEFSCVYHTQVNNLRLFYAAEMDCINSNHIVDLNVPGQLKSVEFSELKTSAWNMNARQKRSFDLYKSQTWWCQSFLVNIKTIWAGLRNQDGLLKEIQKFDVSGLQRNKPWSPAAMGTFLDQFLSVLKTTMERFDEQTAVQIDFKPSQNAMRYTVLQGKHEMLPDWYCELLQGKGELETAG